MIWNSSTEIPSPPLELFVVMLPKAHLRNRFKGLDLIDRVPDELWMEVNDIVQETGIKTILKEKKWKKNKIKWLSEEAYK